MTRQLLKKMTKHLRAAAFLTEYYDCWLRRWPFTWLVKSLRHEEDEHGGEQARRQGYR